MSFEVGIVGLPNVGKSTLFRAVTSAPAEAANYPFCTIEPNVGIVNVPDSRIDKLIELIQPQKVVPNTLKMVDIAGLVKGASKGEGLGNQFLSHIRQVDAIAHLVRCFENDNVVHVEGKIDPLSDIDVIKTELILADIEQIERKIQRMERQAKADKSIAALIPFLQELLQYLGDGNLAKNFSTANTDQEDLLKELNLITSKPFFYVMNVAEDDLSETTELQKSVMELAEADGVEHIKISCQIEAELAEMDGEDKREFLHDLGIDSSGLDQLIQKGFKLLQLLTFFTAGKKEVHAWNVKSGSQAPQAAGKIHSDMERGFICAEVFHFDDMAQYGSEAAVKEAGKLRLEGKDYVVRDGDIMHFRFNV